MKKHFVRNISILLSTALGITLLSGCSSTNTSSNSSPAPAKPAAEVYKDKDPKEYTGTIKVWSFTAELKFMVDEFNKVYPNAKVVFEQQPSSGYSTKMRTMMKSNTPGPDVFVAEEGYVREFVQNKYWEDLSQAPFGGEELSKNMIDYVVDIGKDLDGHLRGLSWQATPGGVWYRRSLAKQYFGTDDPDKISDMMKTLDGFTNMAKTIKEQSGGKHHMIASYEDLGYFFQTGKAWIEDKKFDWDPKREALMDYAKMFRDNDYEAKLSTWDAPWSASMVNGTVFCYVLPTWGLNHVFKDMAPATSGDWALAKGPSSFYSGGTFLGIHPKSQNKELAWQFIKYATSNKDFLLKYATEKGDFVNSKEVIAQMSQQQNEPFVAGQKLYKFFNDELAKIKAPKKGIYDSKCGSVFNENLSAVVDGKKTKEKAVEAIKKEIRNTYPDVEVE